MLVCIYRYLELTHPSIALSPSRQGLTYETVASAQSKDWRRHVLAASGLYETGMAFPASRLFLFLLRLTAAGTTTSKDANLEHLYGLTLVCTVAVLFLRHFGRLWLVDRAKTRSRVRTRWRRAAWEVIDCED